MVKVGMIDADLIDNGTRHPNLAQMKISGYCKSKGHDVKLLYGSDIDRLQDYDLIVVSKVFTFTKIPYQLELLLSSGGSDLLSYNTSVKEALIDSQSGIQGPVISIGGTGFFEDGGRSLDPEIETHMPDYNLYEPYVQEMILNGYKESNYDDYRYYSIGFITRGCFRKCSFCVNKKYNRSFKSTDLSSFYDESRPRIYLWDDNILSYGKGWEAVFNELNRTGKPFQFRQGLDIRLITEKRAKIISRSNYYGDYIFAFDHIEDRSVIENRLMKWRKYCKKTTKLYVLCAYDPLIQIGSKVDNELRDIINTFERIKVIMEYGCIPYIMRYESYKESTYKDLYIQIARWCNQPQFFKKKSFREYCEANQSYSKTSNECSSYRAMIDFEKQYPDVALEYFDLKYSEVSKYDLSFNYGRIKSEPCCNCQLVSKQWDHVDFNSTIWLKDYFDHTLDITCLMRNERVCSCSIDFISKKVVDCILSTPFMTIISMIERYTESSIDVNMIPQFSKYDDSTYNLLSVLMKGDMTYDELGQELFKGKNSPNSNKKYGENHAKMGSLLDLAIIRESDDGLGKKKIVSISPIGKYIFSLDSRNQQIIFSKLCLRIEIIQQSLVSSRDYSTVKLIDVMKKSGAKDSTINRRSSNVREIISKISEHDVDVAIRMNRIK